MNNGWPNFKLFNNILLVIIMLLGLIVAISGGNIFVIYIGMEIKMFGVIPFILLNKENENSKINVGLYYFLVQVFGRVTFLWGNIIGKYILGIIGLCLKMGIRPFFWWVPSIFKRLDWFSIVIIGTIQKIPSFIILRMLFDYSATLGLYLGVLGVVVSVIGIRYTDKDLKVLMAWSSVGKMRLICFLLVISIQSACMYFFCYTLTFIVIGHLLVKNSIKGVRKRSISAIKTDLLVRLRVGVLTFAGLPPLLGFQWKLYFFSGLKESESMFLPGQIEELPVLDYMVEFPLCQDLVGWKIALIVRLLLTIQIAAYIKVFIQMFSSYARGLLGRRRLNSKKIKIDLYIIIIVIIRLIFLSL